MIACVLLSGWIFSSCKRGKGGYRAGYPGGLRFELPFTFYPGDLFRSGRGKSRKAKETPALEALYKRKILPMFQEESFLQETAWLRAFLDPVEDPCGRTAATFLCLAAKGVSYHAGHVQWNHLTGEPRDRKETLAAVISPTQTLSLKAGTTEDLVVLLAALLHGVGDLVGMGLSEEGQLRLLVRCDSQGPVLEMTPQDVSVFGWIRSTNLLFTDSKESLAEIYWLPTPPLVDRSEAPEREELEREILNLIEELCDEVEPGELQRRVCSSARFRSFQGETP